MFYLVLMVLFFAVLLIEGSLLAFFFVGQMLPDLLLVMVIAAGFLVGEKRGALIGLGGGLMQDILFGSTLGYFGLSKMILGIGAGLAGREIYRETLIGPLMLVFVGTIIHEFVIFFLMNQFTPMNVTVEWNLTRLFLPRAFFNAAVTVPLYPCLRWAFKRWNWFGLKIDF